MTALTTEAGPATDHQGRKKYLLAELRCAALRVRLAQCDIDAVGLALKAGVITPDQACLLLADAGVLGFLGKQDE
jgi:hypothetical protein